MTTITISQELIKEKELVLIPRSQYEDLLRRIGLITTREAKLTQAQKKRLKTARINMANGKFFTINDLKRKLGVKN